MRKLGRNMALQLKTMMIMTSMSNTREGQNPKERKKLPLKNLSLVRKMKTTKHPRRGHPRSRRQVVSRFVLRFLTHLNPTERGCWDGRWHCWRGRRHWILHQEAQGEEFHFSVYLLTANNVSLSIQRAPAKSSEKPASKKMAKASSSKAKKSKEIVEEDDDEWKTEVLVSTFAVLPIVSYYERSFRSFRSLFFFHLDELPFYKDHLCNSNIIYFLNSHS